MTFSVWLNYQTSIGNIAISGRFLNPKTAITALFVRTMGFAKKFANHVRKCDINRKKNIPPQKQIYFANKLINEGWYVER